MASVHFEMSGLDFTMSSTIKKKKKKCYIHNTYTILSLQILGNRLLQVFNLNPPLKLLSCPSVTTCNKLSPRIYFESVMKMLWI